MIHEHSTSPETNHAVCTSEGKLFNFFTREAWEDFLGFLFFGGLLLGLGRGWEIHFHVFIVIVLQGVFGAVPEKEAMDLTRVVC
jgi:hypothetical protein